MNRAQILIKDSDGWLNYIDAFGAQALPYQLLSGPTNTHLLTNGVATDEVGVWLGNVYAESGLVVDHTKRIMLFYATEISSMESDYRLAYLHVLRCVWSGWSVHWAPSELSDIQTYVNEGELGDASPQLVDSEDLEWKNVLLSVRRDKQYNYYLIDGKQHIEIVTEGLTALNVIVESCDVYFGIKELPDVSAGLHIDFDNMSLSQWEGYIDPSVEYAYSKDWREWTMSPWKTYSDHLEILAADEATPYTPSSPALNQLRRDAFSDRNHTSFGRAAACIDSCLSMNTKNK